MRAAYYETLEDNIVKCRLCPHLCRIPQEKPGLCGGRRNVGGALEAESYGKITALALDPIEKKPLYHFYPGSTILSVGSYGCNLNCPFCQNHTISMEQPHWEYLSPEDLARHSKSLEPEGNIGVAYTYNEPLISFEYIRDCAQEVKQMGGKNILVTNGTILPEPLEGLLVMVDALNIDLKCFREDTYQSLGGSLETVKHTIESAANRCHVEVTTLIVPGLNDNEEEINDLSKWLSGIGTDIPLHISRFFPRYNMSHLSPTPIDTIYNLVDRAKQYLSHVYPGNC